MLHNNTAGFATSLLFLVLSSPAWFTQSDQPIVEGYVYDADAKPMKKVEVRVYYHDNAYAKADTDEKGYYKVLFTKDTRHPIRVSYFPRDRSRFSDLRDLSGSTNHSISRIQHGEAGVYTVQTLIQLNNDAQEAISSARSEDKAFIRDYYRALLGNVRLESTAVPNDATGAFIQSSFNETRRLFGMHPEPLKTEKGEPIIDRPYQPPPPRPRATNSCFTIEVLQEMLSRICSGQGTSIVGLSHSEATTLRMRVDCGSVRRIPNSRDRP